jgi:hypothetical protein
MTHTTISVVMKLNDTHHHQWVNEIKLHTPPSVCWWNWMIHTTISDFINSLMVECIIQFHQHTDGGVYHSISSTHWWWCVSFNFINTLMVECIIQFHQHTDGGDTLHHQCFDEIEWYTPSPVCWWNWMIHSTISELMKLNGTHHHQCVNEIEWHTPPSVS